MIINFSLHALFPMCYVQVRNAESKVLKDMYSLLVDEVVLKVEVTFFKIVTRITP